MPRGSPAAGPAAVAASAKTDRALARELREILFRPPKFVYDDCTARQAANHMVNHNIGRLPVVLRSQPTRLLGIVTRSEILSAHRRQIEEDETRRPVIPIPRLSTQVRSLGSRLFR